VKQVHEGENLWQGRTRSWLAMSHHHHQITKLSHSIIIIIIKLPN
jgi:hypothetical protein